MKLSPMVIVDITTAVLNVLKTMRKPTEADEIAFRVRSTSSAVTAELDSLSEAKLVKKTDATHYLLAKEEQRLSLFAVAFTHNGCRNL